MSNRIYKFRAWIKTAYYWDKDADKTPYRMIYPHLEDNWWVIDCKTQTLMEGEGGTVSDFPMTLMQYTGLKDKNGKEVYEGDIVKHRKLDRDSDGLMYGVGEMLIDDKPHHVKWSHAGFYPFSGWVDIADLEYEVIGNVWENPELIN